MKYCYSSTSTIPSAPSARIRSAYINNGLPHVPDFFSFIALLQFEVFNIYLQLALESFVKGLYAVIMIQKLRNLIPILQLLLDIGLTMLDITIGEIQTAKQQLNSFVQRDLVHGRTHHQGELVHGFGNGGQNVGNQTY